MTATKRKKQSQSVSQDPLKSDKSWSLCHISFRVWDVEINASVIPNVYILVFPC